MRDKRPVDELSIEELERILAIRKREARQAQLRRLSNAGRRSVPSGDLSGTEGPVQPATPVRPAGPPQIADAPNGQENALPAFEDEYTPAPAKAAPAPRAQDPFWRMVWNRSLLLIEVGAFVAMLVIGAQMIQALQTLQTETAAVQAEAEAQALASLPTPSVTPEINLNRIVLPSGHTPPTNGQSAQFNYSEIPEHLRPMVQQQMAAPISLPTPGPESPTRIQIPALNLDASIVTGTDWEALKRGVGHQPGTGLPGERGNVVLSAHNDIYGELFRHLDQLEPGDQIIISTFTQRYTYVVREYQIVRPSDVWVMDSTHNPTTTLISCYPYQVDNQRIVVFADLAAS